MSGGSMDPSINSTPTTDSTITTVSSSRDGNLQITNVPVVVTWTNPADHDGLLQYLSHSTHDHVTFSFHSDVDARTAFFQLRANVALKNRRDRTNVLLSVPPENIRALALVEDAGGMEVATSRLATSTRCLRFEMREPPSLIVPQGDITPKQKASRIVLDSLRVLAGQTVFSVHLPSSRAAGAQLLALCTQVTSSNLRSTAKFSDIASLYGGKGGRVLEGDALKATSGLPPLPAGLSAMPGDQGDSPPSYDESRSEASSSRPFSPQKSGNKRRRASSGCDTSSRPHQCADLKTTNIEDICRKMMTRIDHGFGELCSRLDCMEQRLSALETCVERHTETLGASIQHVQDRSSEQAGELRDELDAGLYDVRKETQDIIIAQVEDEMYVARESLEDHIKDEMAAMEERLEQKLEEDLTSANVSLEFNWNR